MRMVRQTMALICCHAVSRGVLIKPALAGEIALDVYVDIEIPLGHRCVNTEVLNVRAGPSEEAELLHQIPQGLRVELWGRLSILNVDRMEQERWGFVMWDEGEGWVAMDYLAECLVSSKAFHAALEVDTAPNPLVTYVHHDGRAAVFPIEIPMRDDARRPGWHIVGEAQSSSTVLPRLRALVAYCLQAPRRFIDWWTSSPSW